MTNCQSSSNLSLVGNRPDNCLLPGGMINPEVAMTIVAESKSQTVHSGQLVIFVFKAELFRFIIGFNPSVLLGVKC